MAHLKWIVIAVVLIAVISIMLSVPQNQVVTIGDPIPDFRLKDLQGNDFFANRCQGQVLLLNFWTTWCTICREELPFIEQVSQKYAARGLTTISILGDPYNIDQALEINAQNNLTYPVLLDQGQVLFKTFGVRAPPYTILVDRSGRIRFIHYSYSAKEALVLEQELLQLLGEK